MPSFTAIDFETADERRDSACAVAVVRVERGRVVARHAALIRPPRARVSSTWIHGLTWADLRAADDFAAAWARAAPLVEGSPFLVAHNAAFDRSVLAACCARAGIPPPRQPWLCTVKLARRTWRRRRNGLADVCRDLGIELRHHDAGSDAAACAQVALAAHRDGAVLDRDLDDAIEDRAARPPRAAQRLRAQLAALFGAPR